MAERMQHYKRRPHQVPQVLYGKQIQLLPWEISSRKRTNRVARHEN
jgi:hypothetical protein